MQYCSGTIVRCSQQCQVQSAVSGAVSSVRCSQQCRTTDIICYTSINGRTTCTCSVSVYTCTFVLNQPDSYLGLASLESGTNWLIDSPEKMRQDERLVAVHVQ